MHSKNNRLNHDFQIAYFLAGACQTPDGAYALLCDLREDRERALKTVESGTLRTKAKIIRAIKLSESLDEAERLEAHADIVDINNDLEFGERNIEAARKELEFIEKCIEQINPHRKYKHLPDPEAHEAAQFDEWKMELIRRAENFLLTTGSIPTDQFNTMRLHPAFETDILPKITEMQQLIRDKNYVIDNKYDVVKLLEKKE